MKEDKKNAKMISFAIEDDLKEALRIEAFHKKLSTSALIRQILEETLKDTLAEVHKETR